MMSISLSDEQQRVSAMKAFFTLTPILCLSAQNQWFPEDGSIDGFSKKNSHT